ncbi:MAG: restriction endonuclease subunit S [Acidobacteria bacterium]|nr:restriction endonuclease subunit S [Acidobacteriota bacterium]
MIQELKAYPEYKPTRVDWLDALPRHWTELSLKRIAVLDNSGSYGDDPDGGGLVLPVATTAQIDRDGNFNVLKMPRRGFSEKEVSRFACRPGDILVVKSSGNAANVISGKVGFVRPETPRFVFSNFLMRLVARRAFVQPEFLFHLLTCNLTRERVKRMVSTTTYPNLRVDEYCYAILPLPPTSEQSAIVEFLGHANRKIERFIRTKRRLIALLSEQKQSIIHRAVTRGLSTDTPLKSSGVSWLGDIPAHWEVMRIKYLLREVDERSKTGAETLLDAYVPWPRGICRSLQPTAAGCITRWIQDRETRTIRCQPNAGRQRCHIPVAPDWACKP